MPTAVATSAPIIEFAAVNKWYGEFHVLRDINLQVAKGERIVICGPSGSGKSTLIRCINRLEEHQAGHLRTPAGGFRDRRARPRARDDEALRDRRGEIGSAERRDLTVGIDVVAVLVGEAAGHQHHARETHQREARGLGQQYRQNVERHARE